MLKHVSWYGLIIKDILEIVCICLMFYGWISWLKQDKQKPLLAYFVLYSAFWAFCFLVNFSILLHMLDATMPIVAMLFILIHQKTLQQNFISLYKVSPATKSIDHWPEQLIRFCLQTEMDLMFLIEHDQAIDDLINVAITIQGQTNTSLLAYVTNSNSFNKEQYIYMNTHGMLLGIHVSWLKSIALNDIENNMMIKSSYFLQNSDALALHYNHANRTFSLILQGTIYGPLTAHELLQSIEKYLKMRPTDKGVHHEPLSEAHKQQPHA